MPTLVVPSTVRAAGFPRPYTLDWPDKVNVDRELYTFDATAWLAEAGRQGAVADVLVGATVTPAPQVFGGVSIDTVTQAAALVQAWLRGGLSNQAYVVTFTLTSAAGRTRAFATNLRVT